MEIMRTLALFVAVCRIVYCSVNFTATNLKEHDLQPSAIEKLLHGGIKKGKSLRGKTVRELQPGIYCREISGGFENYIKWPFHLWIAEQASGTITTLLNTIEAGEVEGFAGRHASVALKGVWERYSFFIDDDVVAHIMVSAPFSFSFYKNTLAIGLCAKQSSRCRSLDANTMYYKNYEFVDKKEYYYKNETQPARVCYDDICLDASMERHHHPVITIRAYPKSYYDLDYSLRKLQITPEAYDEFMKHKFNITKPYRGDDTI